MHSAKSKKKWVEEIERSFTPKPRTEEVHLSLILPTYNCGATIDRTLDSIRRQHYPSLEVIVVDAGSTDQTHAILAEYAQLITRVYSVSGHNIAEMINRGTALASGDYIAVLYPGSCYLSNQTYNIFAEAVLDYAHPDLVYCGTTSSRSMLLINSTCHELSLKEIKRGRFPVIIGGCWIRRDFFLKLGKLNPNYKMRFMFDMLCRIMKQPKKRLVHLDRSLVESDLALVAQVKGRELAFPWDTWKILKHHFGTWAALRWFASLPFTIVVKLFWRALKKQIFEEK
ncbi:MAG: glycosyltransferase [Chlamydiales bacterium]|nr:glycosyltransferase [Chlamydiales bacterium]